MVATALPQLLLIWRAFAGQTLRFQLNLAQNIVVTTIPIMCCNLQFPLEAVLHTMAPQQMQFRRSMVTIFRTPIGFS